MNGHGAPDWFLVPGERKHTRRSVALELTDVKREVREQLWWKSIAHNSRPVGNG